MADFNDNSDWLDGGFGGNGSGSSDGFGNDGFGNSGQSGSFGFDGDGFGGDGGQQSGFDTSGIDMTTLDEPQEQPDFNVKKVAIIASAVGLVILIGAFWVWGHFRKADVPKPIDTTVDVPQTQQVESTVDTKNTSTDMGSVSNSTVGQGQNTVNSQVNNQNTYQNGSINSQTNYNQQQVNTVTETSVTSQLIEVDSNTIPVVSDPISGYFTIIDIKTFARQNDGNYGNYFKSILYGNITGMTGVYELTIPTSKIGMVHVGDTIDIKYTTASVGNEKFVVDIN